MKKIVFAFVAVIIVAIALVYILIPDNFIISTIIYTNHKPATVLRCLHDNAKWQQWFPGKTDAAYNFYYNDQQYVLGEKSYSSIDVSIVNKTKYASVINTIPINADSVAIQWLMQFKGSNNPFNRIDQYETAKKIKNDMIVLLDSFKTFIQSTKNIYDFDIKLTTLTDTTLLSIKTSLHEYPSTNMIYELVAKLRTYIKQQNASEHNYPMLNVTQKDSSYEVMVGIPTNIPLQGNDLIQPKRMIMMKNKTLVTEVIGDTSVIKKGLQATNNYMSDYELSAPVIPFQQLITDRSKVKDSTKWRTRIFSPII